MIVRFLAVWLFTSGIVGLMIYFFSSKERSEIYKVVKKIAEDGRVSLRSCRHSAVENIRKLEKDKAVTEDESFHAKDEIQKLTDKFIKDIDTFLAGKEKEIQG